MTYDEKSAWIGLVLAVVTSVVYGWWILSRWDGGPLVDVDYVAPMLWTIGGSIVVSIVLHAFLAGDMKNRDQRDKEIARFGERVGSAFVVIAALAALLMAVREWDYFWIANVIYVCFVLSAIVGAVARLVAYRQDFTRW